MAARPVGGIADATLAHHFVGDHEGMDGAAVKGVVNQERPIHQGFDDRQFGEYFRLFLGKGDQAAPGCAGPVKQRDVPCWDRGKRPLWVDAQPVRQVGPAERQPAQSVVARPPIKPARAVLQLQGMGQVRFLGLLRFLLHECIGVLRITPGGSQQQAAVSRVFVQQAVDEFQAERHRRAYQFGIVVRRERCAALRNGVADVVNRKLAHRTSAESQRQCRQHYAHLCRI